MKKISVEEAIDILGQKGFIESDILKMKFDRFIDEVDQYIREKEKPIKNNITSLFKKWIVKRPNGQCQILFSLTELDKFVDEILLEIKRGKQKKYQIRNNKL